MPTSTKLLLCAALAVRGLGVFVRGLRMLLSFRGVLIALHVIVLAVLFGRGAMGLRGTLMVLCRKVCAICILILSVGRHVPTDA